MPTPKRPRGRPKGSKNKGAAKTRVRLLRGCRERLWVLANCGKWGTQGSGEEIILRSEKGKGEGESKGLCQLWAENVTECHLRSSRGHEACMRVGRARVTVASASKMYLFLFFNTRLISSESLVKWGGVLVCWVGAGAGHSSAAGLGWTCSWGPGLSRASPVSLSLGFGVS